MDPLYSAGLSRSFRWMVYLWHLCTWFTHYYGLHFTNFRSLTPLGFRGNEPPYWKSVPLSLPWREYLYWNKLETFSSVADVGGTRSCWQICETADSRWYRWTNFLRPTYLSSWRRDSDRAWQVWWTPVVRLLFLALHGYCDPFCQALLFRHES